MLIPDMTVRSSEPELMDQPDVDTEKLHRTIRQFDVINRLFSASVRLFRRRILPLMKAEPTRIWTLLDFGSGGCDVDRAIVRLCRRHRLKVRITALDADPRVLPWARTLCQKYPEITPVQGSFFTLGADEEWDFVISNHTLHHFEWPDVVDAVGIALKHARKAILLGDLRRSPWGYLGYTIFTGLLLHRSLAFYDGRLSIRRGFTVDELQRFLTPMLDRIEIGSALPARVWIGTKPVLP